MKAVIVTIGDEILIGQIVNTNASWLARKLTLGGFEVQRVLTVKDTGDEILKAVDDAFAIADIAVFTGGLGPTADDVTKKALAGYFESDLRFDAQVFDDVKHQFESRGIEMPEINREQAMVPDKCIPLRNKNGTAPGMWFEKGGKVLVSMPGVPVEMKTMFEETVLPKLRKKYHTPWYVEKTILTSGLGESALMEKIAPWEREVKEEGVKLAYLPSPGRVRLRISATGDDKKNLEYKLEKLYRSLEKRLPEYIYGTKEETIQQIVGKLLLEKRLTVSTAESCTGGYMAHLITSVPGSSAYFEGSVVSYSNKVKTSVLGVDRDDIAKYGAVSRQVVEQMAEGARRVLRTDIGLATSGIAGPDGGTPEKPVGTVWIALAMKNGVKAKKLHLTTDRLTNIRSASEIVLQWLRKELLKDL